MTIEQDLKEIFDRAKAAFKKRNWTEAENSLIQVIRIQFRYPGALELLEEIQKKKDAEESYVRGLKAQEGGDWETAIEQFETAVELDPDHREAEAKLEEARGNNRIAKPSKRRSSLGVLLRSLTSAMAGFLLVGAIVLPFAGRLHCLITYSLTDVQAGLIVALAGAAVTASGIIVAAIGIPQTIKINLGSALTGLTIALLVLMVLSVVLPVPNREQCELGRSIATSYPTLTPASAAKPPTALPTGTIPPPLSISPTSLSEPTAASTKRPTSANTLTPTTTELQAATATPSATLPPTPYARIIVQKGVHIRTGPGMVYPVATTAAQGAKYPVVGTNPQRDWVQVLLNSPMGWIYAGLVELENASLVALPVATDIPPLPTLPLPKPSDTPKPTVQECEFGPITHDTPPQNSRQSCMKDIELRWSFGGELAADSVYSVRIWLKKNAPDNHEVHARTRDTSFVLKQGGYAGEWLCWNVQAVSPNPDSNAPGKDKWLPCSENTAPWCFYVRWPDEPG